MLESLVAYGVMRLGADPGSLQWGDSVEAVGRVLVPSEWMPRREEGLAIGRAGAVIAVCADPALGEHPGALVRVRGVLRCMLDGRPCTARDDAEIPTTDPSWLDTAIPVLESCTWEVVEERLPDAAVAALDGVRTLSGGPAAPGAEVVAEVVVSPRPNLVILPDGQWAGCRLLDPPPPGTVVWVRGTLGCEPGLVQECTARGDRVAHRVGMVYPAGHPAALPVLDGCRVSPELEADERGQRARQRRWWRDWSTAPSDDGAAHRALHAHVMPSPT